MRVKWSQRWSRAACEHQPDGDDEDRRADDVDLGRHGDPRRAPHEERERRLAPGDKVGDDEVVDREGEREQAGGEDAGRDQRQRHAGKRRQRVGEEVHRRLFEVAVEADEPRPHGHHDEADVEHDVRDQDRREPEREAVVQEEREERRAHDDLRRRHRQEDEQARRAPAAEAVADERERDEGAERRRRDARERRDLQRELDRAAELRVAEGIRPVLEREALPDEVPPPRGVVEREEDDDGDRDEQVGEREGGEEREDVPAHACPEAAARARARAGNGLGGDRHAAVVRSVPMSRV
jgi:hypothetical protein